MEEPNTETEQKEEGSVYTAKYWHEQLETYRREIEEKWSKQRENLDKLYSRDERADSADREYSIFWANIEVLKPAIYARPPQPVVAPRFKDGNQVARSASETLERCLVTTFEQSDLDGCMREVRDEFLRYGRGVARARLSQRNNSPAVEFDNFTACDFAHDAKRSWREVNWVGFRAWPKRDAFHERFEAAMEARGLDVNQVPVKKQDKNSATTSPADEVPVWEIWCRESGKVYFVNEDFGEIIEEVDPWLDLTSFWPCPKPAFGTLVPGKLKPVPDIRQYKDQIEEINEYTARIAALSEGLRLKGFYPAGSGELSDAIEAAVKNTDNRQILIPVSSFAGLGGTSFKESIVWLPFAEVIALIQGLVELRRVLIDDVYQITGISDIIRGQSEASETATAQQIKAQWGSVRIRERQNEVARFARDLTRIAAEVIAENFDGQTIAQMAQVQMPSMAQKQQAQFAAQQAGQQPPKKLMETPSFEEVMAFLSNDKARGFTIEIETDSTIQPDEDAEKQRRMEFVTAVGGLMKEAFPIVQAAPQFGPFVGEILKFTAQGFRAGRPLESAIDQFVEQLEQIASQPKQPQVDPTAQVKLETEKVKGQAAVMKANVDMQKTQMDMQESTLKHNQDMERMAMQATMPQQPNQVQ